MRSFLPPGPARHAWSRARIAALVATWLLGATGLRAQSASQRIEIEAFRDSVVGVSDTVSLLTAERALIVHASREMRDSAMIHLRLGFLAMRLGDLSGKKHYESAASEFQWATDLQPRWPYGWFGLGLAELGVGDAEFALFRGLQSALGKDALTRSANDFARSAEVDPGFARGLVELSNTALLQRVNLRMGVALVALRRAARTPAARNPDVLLARARIEREVGSPDSALAAVDSLVAHRPADAVAQLEQARVRFAIGRRDGGIPWYRGLAAADSTAVALYRTDLRFVLPDSTLHAFDIADGPARAVLMRHFWELRDRDELHAPGDRLEEHYRRLEVARHNYRLATVHRHYDIIERYRPPVQEFDDRGVVYIRQGEPDARASLALPGLPNNESWAYHRSGEPDLLFHFVAREGIGDFRLVASILDIVGYANTVRLENSGDIQGADAPLIAPSARPGSISADSAGRLRQRLSDASLSLTTAAILRSRLSLDPIYQRMLTSGRNSASGIWNDERAIGVRSIRIGTTTDRWQRHYTTPLPADVQVFAATGDSRLQVAYGIPSSAASAAPRVRVSILGLDGTVVGVLDSLLPAVDPVRIGANSYRLGLVSLPVAPGRFTVRVGLEAGGAGVVGGRDTVIVPAPEARELTVSDLVLGAASVPLWWPSDHGDTVRVNPVTTFHVNQPIEVAFDISGLLPDSGYTIAMTARTPGHSSPFRWLARIFGGDRDPFTAQTTQKATDGRILVDRSFVLRDRKPGHYVLEVTVSRRSAPKVTKTQEFTVVP